MAESLRLVDAFPKQQIYVFQEKRSALAHRHFTRGASGSQIGCLRQDPRISQHSAANKYAADAAAETVDDMSRLDAVAAAEHRNAEVSRDVGYQAPVRRT